ncbi:Clp protease ClpP [Paracoccus sp. MBLB3053]|uniref:Clp protease ClpP n=1 Tax=Paracoccus aurantius TaxID=3073814 RepID=A0ABU2HU81_9RHOB|nr:Clp protease ClpP [Paracoccus sp. MBLB3053]MDS9468610.1 Clp protease ClpP [Paracoccus sp. MBLB3053]
MKRKGADLIIGGELVLSGYVMSDDAADWSWEEEAFFSPALVRDALLAMGEGRVTVRLNSAGGDPISGEAIRATLANHPGGVRIVVEGQASSAASLILMGAAEREMTTGSFIMLHNPRGYVYEGAEGMRAQADFLDMLARVYAQVYADRSGQGVDAVLAIMAAETFYTAEAAIAAGFIDALAEEAQPATPAPIINDSLRARMRREVNAYGALMRAHAPGPGPALSRDPAVPGGTPAPVAATMELDMPNETNPTTPPNPAPSPAPNPVPAAANPAAAPVPPAPDPQAVAMQERSRIRMLRDMATPFMAAGRLTEADLNALIDDGTSAEMAGSRFMATMAGREGVPAPRALSERGRDETETRRLGMEGALIARLSGRAPEDVARPYMDFSIVDMAAERMGARRVPGNFAAREEMLRMAFQSTSDFPVLLEGAMNRSLAARYQQAQPTYRRLARQRSYQDFRDHSTVRMGDFPDLQPVSPEGGELKGGSFSESKEKTSVKAYGVKVLFTRQLLVNDSLDGIMQVLNDRGDAVARFEDRIFYEMMLSGANGDGPGLNETGRQVFNTTDGTKAGTAAAINVTSLSAARAALRKRKGLDGAELELTPQILLVGPDKETEAQQYLYKGIMPAQAGSVNVFNDGSLSLGVTAKITGNAWYVFASPASAPCFEWGLLDGYSAPRFRMEDPFGVQGTRFSLEHDFGCGAIDFRGGYKNAGA